MSRTEVLVDADWVQAHSSDEGVVLIEVDEDTAAYDRGHTWFVLHELLGLLDVKNYDGSWTEYGSLVGVPVAAGDE